MTTYQCGCGAWMGDQCEADPIPAEEMIVVEWMPEWLRASHKAARNSGVYPHNGAARVAVHPECAANILEHDPDWAEKVAADPAEYAQQEGGA